MRIAHICVMPLSIARSKARGVKNISTRNDVMKKSALYTRAFYYRETQV